MKEIFKTKSFWIIFLLASFVITASFFNLKKTFQAEIDFLIIPQSEVSVKNSSQIISNLSALPKTVSFFEKIIEENQDLLNGGIGESSDNEKKEYWNEKIKIDNFKETGIIKITVSDKDRFQAEDLADEIKDNFIKSVGIYYDIEKDIDVRLIEEPIIKDTFSQPFWIIISEGFLTGFLISLFSFFLSFSLLEKNQKNVKKQIKKDFFQSRFSQNKESFFEIKSNENERGELLKKKVDKSKMRPWILAETAREENYFSGYLKKAVAPDNLPVASEKPEEEYAKPEKEYAKPREKEKYDAESVLISEKKEKLISSVPISQSFSEESLPKFKSELKENLSEDLVSEGETEDLKIHEPTPEEVKERLNKLLSGGKI